MEEASGLQPSPRQARWSRGRKILRIISVLMIILSVVALFIGMREPVGFAFPPPEKDSSKIGTNDTFSFVAIELDESRIGLGAVTIKYTDDAAPKLPLNAGISGGNYDPAPTMVIPFVGEVFWNDNYYRVKFGRLHNSQYGTQFVCVENYRNVVYVYKISLLFLGIIGLTVSRLLRRKSGCSL